MLVFALMSKKKKKIIWIIKLYVMHKSCNCHSYLFFLHNFFVLNIESIFQILIKFVK